MHCWTTKLFLFVLLSLIELVITIIALSLFAESAPQQPITEIDVDLRG